MASLKALRHARAIAERAGVEVLGFEPAKGAHFKMRCKIEDDEFFILVSASGLRHKAEMNFAVRMRRIRRLYDNDPDQFLEELKRSSW